MELCEAALAALDILQPQVTSRRGLVLYELHTGLLLTGRQSRDKAALARSLACLQVRRTILVCAINLFDLCFVCPGGAGDPRQGAGGNLRRGAEPGPGGQRSGHSVLYKHCSGGRLVQVE